MRVASMGSMRPSSNATGLGFQPGPKLSPRANPKHHHHQSLGLGSNLSPSPLPCMGKPKAAISSWASPLDEVSTVSDIDERKRMAELPSVGFSPWDRPSKSSDSARKATKKTLTRVIHPAKRKIKRREVAGLVGKWRATGGAGEWKPRG